ncbi:helicase-like protein [Flavobacterium sp. 90]|uniref:DEAD/DEAH box helicase n=1 Tax=unclassified Flavobacterium TaxID=196869 RepID=UPI000EAC5149|nr:MULTISPECIES: DEAD/DEAH box helicase [unclassified Flavobacterium]RKR08189.1 helicase-like protein [Flavobacterium sp. 81]TCK57380.1 helicase-like protein [Flavobacterium sp. 90]
MYNTTTEEVIKKAPHIEGLNTENLPQYLTKIYARIVSVRMSLDGSKKLSPKLKKDIHELRKLANNLESFTVLSKKDSNQVSAAFVAGTAHNLLQLIRDQKYSFSPQTLESHSVPNWISSILLFLIGDSPADAAEIAVRIAIGTDDSIKFQLSNAIRLLAMGNLGSLRALEPATRDYNDNEIDIEAEDYLWLQLLLGLQQMASVLLGITSTRESYFKNVVDLASIDMTFTDIIIKRCYSAPFHLATLLDILEDRLLSRGVINVKAPAETVPKEWHMFLQKLAESRPYLWENHFEAVHSGFLDSGCSAVLTFPTGAGKTTVAELKIASTIMAGKSVLYLVPTHALEDQINRDLNTLFDYIDSDKLEIGGEFTDFENGVLETINVMTPERCLTLLAINPESFEDIGLIVFDEFHLVHGRAEKLDKRSLDAMYCLLKLFTEVPAADYLLISAMVENGEEISSWVEHVIGRECKTFNSDWKPTRQLQSCIIYPKNEIKELEKIISDFRKNYNGKTVPTRLKTQINSTAHQIYSLRNKWEADKPDDFFVRKLFNKKFNLEVSPYWKITSNRNAVASELAAFFVNAGMKTLLFVNNPVAAKSTARRLNSKLDKKDLELETFNQLNQARITSIEMELGDLQYSFYNPLFQVAVHHGLLLPIERQLNESLFKSKEGIHAIVATATLAQGINLPAEVVIIAGDDRFDEDTDGSEKLLAHEILNAAGRAGRAGTAAQGVAILVPGQIITFENKLTAPTDWIELQKRVFAKSDQCLVINDPMTQFLDEVTAFDDNELLSQNVNSLLLRLHSDETEEASIKAIFSNSFAFFKANLEGDDKISAKINELIIKRENLSHDLLYDKSVEAISLKTGINPNIIEKLSKSISELDLEQIIAYSVSDWISWFVNWLQSDEIYIYEMFSSPSSRAQLARALGLKVTNYDVSAISKNLHKIVPIFEAYISGQNYETINEMIPGKSDEYLSKSRHFILRLVPHKSFALGIVSLTIKEILFSYGYEPDEIPYVIKNLATMVKEGLDTEEKLQYKIKRRTLMRVQIHRMFEI